jgi:hypothetical protein
MVSRFLLHDPSDIGIGGVSGEGKFRVWGRVLEWHCHRQEAFCILESLLSGSGPLHVLALPSGDQSKVSKFTHSCAESGG